MVGQNTQNLTDKTVSGVIWKFAERIAAQVVSTIISIVLARILMPQDYGLISIVSILIGICNVFVSNGFGNALIQKKEVDETDFSSVFYVSIVLALFIYTLMFFAAPYIADFYNNSLLAPILRVMFLRIPFAAINSVQQAYVARQMAFKKFFFATLIGTVISGVVGLVMAYRGFGVWALVGQYLINVTIDTLILWFTVKWRPKLIFSFMRVKGLFAYGWKLLVSGLLETGYNELRSLIIAKKYSATDLAYYDKGKQFPNLIITNIYSALTSVLFAAMSKVQDEKVKVKQVTRKALRITSYIIVPCMVGLGCIAEPFVRVVLTNKWLPIVPYIRIMCFVNSFWAVHISNLEALKAVGRSDLFLRLEIIKKVIGITVLLVAMWYGVFWIAVSAMFTTVISAFINAFPNKKILDYGYKEQIKDIGPVFILGIIMGIAVYLFGFLSMNVYLLLTIQILVGIVIYVVGSYLFKMEAFYFILNYLKKFFKRFNHVKTND